MNVKKIHNNREIFFFMIFMIFQRNERKNKTGPLGIIFFSFALKKGNENFLLL